MASDGLALANLTTRVTAGTRLKVNAELLLRRKSVLSDGAIVELVIWRVPVAVPGSPHLYKYSLFYGKDGRRIVGYDNERLKGDHRHAGDRKDAYAFTSVERLIEDFLADVALWRDR